MSDHQYTPARRSALKGWCEWSWLGRCSCGAEDAGHTTKKRALRWYREHQLAVAAAEVDSATARAHDMQRELEDA